MPEVGGPDAQMTSVSVELTAVEERKLPSWVTSVEDSDRIWGSFNAYLRGTKVLDIASEFSVSPATVYRWIEAARAELPYHVLSKAAELVNVRMQWVQMAWKAAEDIQSSQLRIDRKAEQISKLMNASGAWLTAIEELTGARRGTGSRININQTAEGAQAIVFDMDEFLKKQKVPGAAAEPEPEPTHVEISAEKVTDD